jgi:sialic acid synthase SpsE/spore coat polysaccharide biosynthesis protein SpsF (cytidylyltransferase family)
MTLNPTTTEDVTIIAEMANAHEGDLSTAKEIVSSVAEHADAVKFQVFTADELVLPSHPDYDEFAELEMTDREWAELIEHSHTQDIDVCADAFGMQSVDLMTDMGVEAFKIHNADISNLSLVEYVSDRAEVMLLSAGGSTWIELAEALNHLQDVPTLLMYGYQNYPTSVEDANLRRVSALNEKFDCSVGYASHAPGDSDIAEELPRLAVAAGATAIEVHITLDRSAERTDYYSSLEPDEFADMAQRIEYSSQLLGKQTLSLSKTEREYRNKHKKWLVATEPIEEGEYITSDNIGYKRLPDVVIDSNIKKQTVVGRPVTKALSPGDPITLKNMDTKVVATLACRSESARLYGKPLQQVGDKPILTHLIEQLQTVSAIDDVVLAIADAPSKHSYIEYAHTENLEYVVGSETNVLGRLIDAGTEVDADIAVRVTTENPYVYTENVDQMIEAHIKQNHDYSLTEKLPLGSSIEIVSMTALEAANTHGTEKHRSELATLFIVENSDSFSVNVFTPPEDLLRPDIRLTVDNPEDLIVARRIWTQVSDGTSPPELRSVIRCVDDSSGLFELNSEFPDGTDDDVKQVRPFMYGDENQ